MGKIKIIIGVVVFYALIYWVSFCRTWNSEHWAVMPTKGVVGVTMFLVAAYLVLDGITDEAP